MLEKLTIKLNLNELYLYIVQSPYIRLIDSKLKSKNYFNTEISLINIGWLGGR